MKNSLYWVNKLKLIKHPEGGYFKEVYRASESIKQEHLPERYSGDRNFATSIYFLISSENFSAFHKIKSDETWHFYYGSPLTLHIIDNDGKYSKIMIGNNPEEGEVFQFTVASGDWFAASVEKNNSYTLLGCTVAPGFHFDDFELGKRKEMIKKFPQYESVINKFTRG
jgi:predicted cupin superfamily sugar epimerase